MAKAYSSPSPTISEGPSSGTASGSTQTAQAAANAAIAIESGGEGIDGSVVNLSDLSNLVISSFNMDFSTTIAAGETRRFDIAGSEGADFTLHIKKHIVSPQSTEESQAKYYNFSTKTFQSDPSSLSAKIPSTQLYRGVVEFPQVTALVYYEIFLFADNNTRHVKYKEVRSSDQKIDENLSSGSNSTLITKKIWQPLATKLELLAYSGVGIGSLNSSHSIDDEALLPLNSNRAGELVPFTLQFGVADTQAIRIIKQPSGDDFFSSIVTTVSEPARINGENIYPEITKAADSTNNGGTTVNGASTGTTVTTHVVSSTIATVGDRVLGNAALAAATVIVTAVSSGSGKTFTINQSIAIEDDLALSFSNQQNYRWAVTTGVDKFDIGMEILSGGTAAQSTQAKIADYKDTTTVFQGTDQETVLVNNQALGVDTLGKASSINYSLGTPVITQPGAITFNKQVPLSEPNSGNFTIKASGTKGIEKMTGYNIAFYDLAVTLQEVKTTSSVTTNNSTSMVVASTKGILDNVSTVSGIGINPYLAAPTVASGAGAVTGAGTLVLSAAQTVQAGQTFTFAGASTVATVTGYIDVIKAGTLSVELGIDLANIVSVT